MWHLMVTLNALSSIDMLFYSFRGNRTILFLQDIAIQNLPLKIERQGHSQGHIQWSHLGHSISFHGNRTIFGWVLANSIFVLENEFKNVVCKMTAICLGFIVFIWQHDLNCAISYRKSKQQCSCKRIVNVPRQWPADLIVWLFPRSLYNAT